MKLCDYICGSSRMRRRRRTGGGGRSSVVIIYVYMNVNPMHMHIWLSVIVPYVFLQVLETSPCRGGSVKIFN